MILLVNIRSIIIIIILLGTVTSASANYPTIITSNNSFPVLDSLELSEDSPLLSWTSHTQNESLSISNNTIIAGDHVVLNATFPEELNVTRCELMVWDGFTYSTTRSLVPVSDYSSVFNGVIDPSQFDWVVIKGIKPLQQVNFFCNFTISDSDFMVWPGDLDESEWAYGNNLVRMSSGDKPETDVITWTTNNDTLFLGCFNYDNTTIGNWTLHVQVGVAWSSSANSRSIETETYYFHKHNGTYNIKAIGYSHSNESYVLTRENVGICNFFTPHVTIFVPEPLLIDERSFNITWSCIDENLDEVNYYSIWLSNNDGYSFMRLAQNWTKTWFVWNSTDWLEDDYMVRVRAYSIDLTYPGTDLSDPPAGYWPGDYGDGLHWIGDPPIVYPPYIFLGVDYYSPYDVNSTGNNITVHIYFRSFIPYRAHYVLDDNEIPWLHGYLYPQSNNQKFNITIDGLTVGIHSLTIKVSAEWQTSSLTFNIIVTEFGLSILNTTSSTTTLNFGVQAFLIGISMGSVAIIGIVVILTIR